LRINGRKEYESALNVTFRSKEITMKGWFDNNWIALGWIVSICGIIIGNVYQRDINRKTKKYGKRLIQIYHRTERYGRLEVWQRYESLESVKDLILKFLKGEN